METIYLDYNSTTPMLPAVLDAMRPYWADTFGNPASAHRAGQRARQALETAREQLAALLGANADEVLFTSGATEANNLALFGLAGDPPGRVIASPIEHPSVAEPVAQLQKRGFQVDYLTVDSSGVVCTDTVLPLLGPDVRLVTVMLANNETGAIQPVAELVRLTTDREHSVLSTQHSVLFHCDAVQAVGKLPVDFHALGVHTLSLSGHKFNGPRGIGALLVRRGTPVRSLFWGGHQQHGLRPGTEAVALAVGLAKALDLACQETAARTEQVRRLRARFLDLLQRQAAPVVLNGPPATGLLHTINLSFPGCRAETLLMKLDLAGVACSTGSACSSGSLLPSPVLQAMGCPPAVLHSALRFSLSHLQTEAEIETAALRIAAAVGRLRRLAE
jgi:cysteine desulfurase